MSYASHIQTQMEAWKARAEKAERERDESRKEHEEDQGVIRVWRGRCERAEADNAALLLEMKRAHDDMESISGGVFEKPHPGSALFEYVRALEAVREAVREFDTYFDLSEPHDAYETIAPENPHAMNAAMRALVDACTRADALKGKV
jgi:hypothetical protein